VKWSGLLYECARDARRRWDKREMKDIPKIVFSNFFYLQDIGRDRLLKREGNYCG